MKNSIYKVVKSVAAPLHYFSVVIIAITLAIVFIAWKSTLPSEDTMRIIYLCLIIGAVSILMVFFLVIKYPKKLTFDRESHITMMREKLGDSELGEYYSPIDTKQVEPPRKLLEKNSLKE